MSILLVTRRTYFGVAAQEQQEQLMNLFEIEDKELADLVWFARPEWANWYGAGVERPE